MSTSSAVLPPPTQDLESQLAAYRSQVADAGLPVTPASHEQADEPVEWMASLAARMS